MNSIDNLIKQYTEEADAIQKRLDYVKNLMKKEKSTDILSGLERRKAVLVSEYFEITDDLRSLLDYKEKREHSKNDQKDSV